MIKLCHLYRDFQYFLQFLTGVAQKIAPPTEISPSPPIIESCCFSKFYSVITQDEKIIQGVLYFELVADQRNQKSGFLVPLYRQGQIKVPPHPIYFRDRLPTSIFS